MRVGAFFEEVWTVGTGARVTTTTGSSSALSRLEDAVGPVEELFAG